MTTHGRLAALVAVVALVLGGCGGGDGAGEVGPEDDVTVGGGVVVQEMDSPTTAPGQQGDPTPDGDGASPHPTDASGAPISNTTIREVDGLVLQLTVDQTVGYEGDLVLDLVVTNEREEAIRYDPESTEGAYILDEEGTVVWRNGSCGGAARGAGHRLLTPDDTARLTYPFQRDGGGDAGCALASGRHQVVGQLFWCPAGSAPDGECVDPRASASHPVTIRLG